MSKYQLTKWIQSQNGSEFCHFDGLSEDVRSQLRQEDKYTTTIDGFRYTVKDYEGKWLVFRRNIKVAKTRPSSIHNNETPAVVEIKIMSLNEANDCLRRERSEYQIFGSDPMKIINNEVCVIMAKYAQQFESKCHNNKTLEQQQVVGPECSNVNRIQPNQQPGGS